MGQFFPPRSDIAAPAAIPNAMPNAIPIAMLPNNVPSTTPTVMPYASPKPTASSCFHRFMRPIITDPPAAAKCIPGYAARMDFRQAIPFLRDIPDDVYAGLHTGEWLLPDADVDDARKRLEQGLGAYVMTYRRDTFLSHLPGHSHLCMNLEGAALDDAQKETLRAAEERFAGRNVSFVAYRKPLVFLRPR